MRLKEDLQLAEILDTESALAFREKRDQLQEEARKAILKIQTENKQSYNKKGKNPSSYAEDDLVAIRRTQCGPDLKLCAKYLGPYQVKRVLQNDRCIVKKVGEGEDPRRISAAVDHMKK